ncbi:hypothetical protein ES705_32255 [subsurface metagenome]
MERWERMKEVFELLDNGNSLTVRELSDTLDIDLQLADNLLRHYNKNGYLTRYKDVSNDNKYTYQLSEKGCKQLKDFLENNEYLDYLEIY